MKYSKLAFKDNNNSKGCGMRYVLKFGDFLKGQHFFITFN